MRFFVSLCAVAVCAALVSGGAAAQQAPENDPRLSATITISADNLMLSEALAKASAPSGVTMKADPDSRQWKVRELPVTLRVKDMPVREFQAQLAKLLDLRWTRTGQAPGWTYTIWQDANARGREESARAAAGQEKTARAEEKWRNVTSAIAAAGRLSGADLEKQAASKPFLKFVATNPFGRSYAGLMSGLADAAVPALAAGETFRAPYTSLPRPVQQHVRGFVEGANTFAALMSGGKQAASNPDWQDLTVTMRPMPAGARSGVMDNLGMLGFIGIDGGGSSSEGRPPIPMVFPIVDPSSEMASMIAKGAERMQNGEDPRAVMRDMAPKVGEVARKASEGPKPEDSPSQQAAPSDPRLLKEVEVKAAKSGDLKAAFDTIAEKTGLAVVADGWTYPKVNIKDDKGEAADVLNRLCALIGADWELDGDCIRIRARDWAERRASMVTAQDLKQWSSRLDADGNLSLDDMALMAQWYSDAQIARIRAYDPKVARATFYLTVPEWRKGLEFYGLLGEKGAAQARTAQGLSVSSLNSAQRDSLAGIGQTWGMKESDLFAPDAAIRVTEDGNTTYLVVPGAGEGGLDIPLSRKRSSSEANEPRQNN